MIILKVLLLVKTENIEMDLNKKLSFGIMLNLGFTIIEMVIGHTSGSLSLVSDAICNLTDVLSLIISFFALKISSKQADLRRTFGYGRVSVLASLLNLVILLTVIITIVYQAYHKLFNPEPIEGITVMIVGFFGIIINGIVAASLFNHKNHLTIKTALFNLTLDVLASFGALVSGIIITLTNKTFVDPIISMTIAGILLIHAFKILAETIDILLESVPKHINIEDIESCIKEFSMVKKIDNLHLWSISNYQTIMMCNIYLDQQDLMIDNQLNQKIKNRLQENFKLQKVTLEITTISSKD